ncbi:hypothetical protein ACTFIR_010963 [Dictyostelium discoideum]
MDYRDDSNEIKEEKPMETKIEKLLEYLPYLEKFLKDEPNKEGNIYTHIDLKKIKVINWATFSNFEMEFKKDIKKVFIIGPFDSGKTNLIRSVQHLFKNKSSFTHTIDTEGNINPWSCYELYKKTNWGYI